MKFLFLPVDLYSIAALKLMSCVVFHRNPGVNPSRRMEILTRM